MPFTGGSNLAEYGPCPYHLYLWVWVFCRFYLVFLHRTTPWFLQSGSSEGLVSSQVLFFKVTSRDSQDRGAAESSSCRGYIGKICGPVTGQVGASSGFCVYSLATIPAGKRPSHCRRSEAPMMFSTGLRSSLRTQCPSRTFDTWGSEGLWFWCSFYTCPHAYTLTKSFLCYRCILKPSSRPPSSHRGENLYFLISLHLK